VETQKLEKSLLYVLFRATKHPTSDESARMVKNQAAAVRNSSERHGWCRFWSRSFNAIEGIVLLLVH
jgi:hypothetical protein